MFIPLEKKVLGILDVVVSMDQVRGEIRAQERGIAALLLLLFLGSAGSIALFLTRYVNRPIRKLIQWTQCIGAGVYDYARDIEREDEIGQLAYAVNAMGTRIRENQEELKRQRDEFQVLFEQTPCFITVTGSESQVGQIQQGIRRSVFSHCGGLLLSSL